MSNENAHAELGLGTCAQVRLDKCIRSGSSKCVSSRTEPAGVEPKKFLRGHNLKKKKKKGKEYIKIIL